VSRLATLRPGLSTLASRLVPTITSETQRSLRRRANDPWRAWYGLKRWKDIRWQVLTRDLFTCQLCGHMESNTSLLVCDHVTPHRGDTTLFWSGPFETLCQQCHSIEKQSQEGGTTASYHPDWLRPSSIPLTIICGPPASGKSTYAKEHAGPYDVVIDLDAILCGLSGRPMHTFHTAETQAWIERALRKRNAILAYLSRTPRWRAAWFIVSAAKADRRDYWCKKLQPREIVVLKPTIDVIAERAAQDGGRDQRRTIASAEAWLRDYMPRAGDRIIEA